MFPLFAATQMFLLKAPKCVRYTVETDLTEGVRITFI